MNKLELYDIITFNDKEKYTIVSMINKDEKKYAMLVGVDSEENPNPKNVKVVELINDNSAITEITNKETLQMITLELSKKSIQELDNEME